MRRLLLTLVTCLLLAACSDTQDNPPATDGAAPQSTVEVATPQLRALKKQAGVEGCRPGAGRSELPALTLPCLGGGPDVELSSLQGPLVINLFAQWCGPCRAELPYYQQLHDRAGDDLTVIGVDYLDTRPDLALELVRQTGVTYPLLADPSGALREPFGIRGLPGLVLVRADGSVDVQFRVVRSYAELRDLVAEGLDVPLP